MRQKALPSSLVLAACLALAGCGPLVKIGGDSTPPTALYTLTATGPGAAATGLTTVPYADTFGVDVPSVPGALQSNRIPVQVTDTTIQYLKGVKWSEQPSRLFQRLLGETLRNAGMPVVDLGASGLHGERRLTGQLLTFGLDTRDGSKAVVRYDATLITPKGMRQRSFSRSAPVSATDGPEAVDALNEVANKVAKDVQQWLAAS